MTSAVFAADVLTQGYDAFRTGAQRQEGVLNPSNVRPATFGKVATLPVDGAIHAQPLFAGALRRGANPPIDVLYLATGNNSVLAYDVTGGRDALLWAKRLSMAAGDTADIGILGTPVIDRGASTLYVVTGARSPAKGSFRLHALDLLDGSEKHGGPVEIEGGVVVDGQAIAFAPTGRRIAVQRAGLALAQGSVVVAFGGDYFEGWVFAFDARDLRKPPATFCTTCASRVQAISKVDYLSADCTFIGPAGGIWQSGRGPVVDEGGKVWFFTGNKAHIIREGCRIPQGRNACSQCTTPGGCVCKGVGREKVCRGPDTCIGNASADGRTVDTNDSLVGLDPLRGLALEGWFRPDNWNAEGMHGLEFNDLDLGGSGPLLIPGTSSLIGGGKDGVLYLLDASRNGQAMRLQEFDVAEPPAPPMQYYRHILGGPVLLARRGDADGSRLFIWRENDVLRSYRVTDRFLDCDAGPAGALACRAVAMGRERIDHHPGGVLAASVDGERDHTAIVWAHTSAVGNGPGRLMAFRALPVAGDPERLEELWNSETCPGDAIDTGSTFTAPTVANGRVYVATGDNRVDVFGLLPARNCEATPQPEGAVPLNNF
ncbi:MAG TPA: PQQ-binding-like beta-propeller repeat protein [Burkholderiales bacterium]|nr:PQQ-binding-like beta-propeller repeat protein [Burkholderiales bacterium]